MIYPTYLQNVSKLLGHVIGRSRAENLAEQRQHLVQALFYVFGVDARAALRTWVMYVEIAYDRNEDWRRIKIEKEYLPINWI